MAYMLPHWADEDDILYPYGVAVLAGPSVLGVSRVQGGVDWQKYRDEAYLVGIACGAAIVLNVYSGIEGATGLNLAELVDPNAYNVPMCRKLDLSLGLSLENTAGAAQNIILFLMVRRSDAPDRNQPTEYPD